MTRKGTRMSCEHLICARCAGPVVEARCPACRAARAEVHHHHHLGLSTPLLIALLVALLALVVTLQQLAH
jgi:predicted amidophosphoribosyltransferase